VELVDGVLFPGDHPVEDEVVQPERQPLEVDEAVDAVPDVPAIDLVLDVVVVEHLVHELAPRGVWGLPGAEAAERLEHR
jgi:hypothetical protein